MSNTGSFGFKGLGKRALEIPDGNMLSGGVAVSPAGRMRFRFNGQTNRAEVSESGGAYKPISAGGSGYALHWGADLSAGGQFANVNGSPSDLPSAAPFDTEQTSPVSARLVAIGWNSAFADATTTFRLFKNAAPIAGPLALSGPFGVIAFNLAAVGGVDKWAIEYTAGTVPRSTSWTAIFA